MSTTFVHGRQLNFEKKSFTAQPNYIFYLKTILRLGQSHQVVTTTFRANLIITYYQIDNSKKPHPYKMKYITFINVINEMV